MRSSAETKLGLDRSVVPRTKSKIACFAGPSFHDGSKPPPGVAVCAKAETGSRGPDKAGSSASVESKTIDPGRCDRLHVRPLRSWLIAGRRVPELLHGLLD